MSASAHHLPTPNSPSTVVASSTKTSGRTTSPPHQRPSHPSSPTPPQQPSRSRAQQAQQTSSSPVQEARQAVRPSPQTAPFQTQGVLVVALVPPARSPQPPLAPRTQTPPQIGRASC